MRSKGRHLRKGAHTGHDPGRDRIAGSLKASLRPADTGGCFREMLLDKDHPGAAAGVSVAR
jgi:hypothetical protein